MTTKSRIPFRRWPVNDNEEQETIRGVPESLRRRIMASAAELAKAERLAENLSLLESNMGVCGVSTDDSDD
jgi:hypothetical protein